MRRFKFGDKIIVNEGVERMDTDFSGAKGVFLFYYNNYDNSEDYAEVALFASEGVEFRTGLREKDLLLRKEVVRPGGWVD